MSVDRPNVLILMTDQQKATSSHLYGNAFCRTPSLERLAARGVLYERAFTPHPLCVPARVSFWTSQYPHDHGARRNETFMPAEATHAAGLWRAAGYQLGLIGKNHCFCHDADLALFDTWCEMSHGGLVGEARGLPWWRPEADVRAAHELRRAMVPQNARFAYAVSERPPRDHGSGLIAGQTVRFLEERGSEPFVLWASFPDPHEPWVVPHQYHAAMLDRVELPPWRDDEFGPHSGAPERNVVLHEMLGLRGDDPADVRGLMAAYYGMVAAVDDGVGQILDALDGLGLSRNTIVVYCSDHGDFMGEHGMQCKGGVFYDCLTRVPLILSWPGQVPEGRRDPSPVSLIDVVPTLMGLQGLAVPRTMRGAGLPTATAAAPRRAAFSEYGAGGPPFRLGDLRAMERPWGRRTLIDSLQWREAEGRRKMVRTEQWKYVHDPMGDRDELYDLVRDPGELTNVVDESHSAEALADLRLRLADWSIATEDGSPVPLPARG